MDAMMSVTSVSPLGTEGRIKFGLADASCPPKRGPSIWACTSKNLKYKVYVDLYRAFLREAPQMRSDMDHTVLPACLYSPAAEHHRPLAGTHFTVPRRVEGRVDLGGWLHTEIKCRLREWNPDTVTHPSTNRAQRRLTSFI